MRAPIRVRLAFANALRWAVDVLQRTEAGRGASSWCIGVSAILDQVHKCCAAPREMVLGTMSFMLFFKRIFLEPMLGDFDVGKITVLRRLHENLLSNGCAGSEPRNAWSMREILGKLYLKGTLHFLRSTSCTALRMVIYGTCPWRPPYSLGWRAVRL